MLFRSGIRARRAGDRAPIDLVGNLAGPIRRIVETIVADIAALRIARERAAVVLLASGKGEFAQPQSLLYLNKMGSLPCLRHFFPPDAILYKHAFTCC